MKKETTTPTNEYKIGEWQEGEPVWDKMSVWKRIIEKIKNLLKELAYFIL